MRFPSFLFVTFIVLERKNKKNLKLHINEHAAFNKAKCFI